ncbi:MAG: hypothetical protein ACM3MD_06300 [Betaproteobacteria bacterium]
MGNLFLSFSIAVGGAICLVTLGSVLNFDSYITRILPIIPIFYAIIYEVLDRRKPGKTTSFPWVGTKAATPHAEAGITAARVIIDVAVSFIVKFSTELFLVALFLRFGGQTFSEAYGTFNIGTVGTFLRGEHPWLTGKEGIYLLALVAIITSFVTGSWIGHTSKGNAILEGVLAGAMVTLINSMTNMLILYRTIEEMTIRLANSMGYVMRAGFLVVIGLQVLLYGLWSGLVQMQTQERAQQKISAKKARK